MGPEFGPVTAYQVENALTYAARRGFENLVFAGFSFDAAAQAIIQDDPNPRVRCHFAHIRPDVIMGGLLKDTPNAQLFTVFGSPRVKLDRNADGLFTITLEGVDVYNPVENTILATAVDKVAAWFVDSDLRRADVLHHPGILPRQERVGEARQGAEGRGGGVGLRGPVGNGIAAVRSRRSRAVAVKVIDPRGNEVMRLLRLDGAREEY